MRLSTTNANFIPLSSSLFVVLMLMILETRIWLSPCAAQTSATNFSVIYCNAWDNASDPTAFLANLETAHAQLRANLSSPASTGFATFPLVRSRVPMYAIFHCRGYTSRPGCLACLDNLFNLVDNRCVPKFRASVFTDGCYLRYAMTNVFDRVISQGQSGFCDEPIRAERWAGFNDTASEALEEVERVVVRRGGRFVAGKKVAASGGGRVVYAAGECLPVLGLEDCQMCLYRRWEREGLPAGDRREGGGARLLREILRRGLLQRDPGH